MARIRTIKPEFPQSESMGRVSRDSRLVFIMLWTIADDSGRLRGNSRMLASLLFPYDDDAKTLIDSWLSELEREECILRYSIGNDSYVQVCNWSDHQKIDKPSRSKIPEFGESSRILANPREVSSEDQGSKDQGSKDHIISALPAEVVKSEQAKPRKAKMQELDNQPAELHEAISIWRGLLKAMRNPELLESFPVEKRYLPAAVGTVEATWRAWKKHRASMVQGHPVTDADILASVKMWASVKMARATDRENPALAAPMLPTMINHPDFVDALIRSVKARIAMEAEVAHVA